MNAENLLYLPKKTKIFAMAILVFSLIFSSFLVIYYLFWVNGESTFVLAALSIFQVSATGAAVAMVAFSARSSFGREALLKETSKWLVEDFVQNLKTIDLPFERDVEKWSLSKKIEHVSDVSVKTDHVEGTNCAFYEIRAFNVSFMIRITLNAYRVVVLFYINEVSGKTVDDLVSSLEMVISGAKNVGYKVTVSKNVALWDQEVCLHEVYFFIDLPKDFLYNGTERLFWAQDICTMTRSAIIQLKRHQWLTPSMSSKF
jgi:hypothetical protein